MFRSCSFILFLAFSLAGCVDKSRDVSSPAVGAGSTGPDTTSGSSTNTDSSEDGFDRQAMMTNLADNVFIPNYQATANLAQEFSSDTGSLATYCGSVGTEDESSDHQVARSDWISLMDAVQKTEMHVVGPALSNDEALQNRVHSYSAGTLATCALDQAVIIANGDEDFQVANRAFNQRGMGAIEYLLFNANLEHSCSSQIDLTASWNDLPEATRKDQRCDLALKLAKDVSAASDLIVDQWTAGDEAYRSEFLAEANLGDNFQMLSDGLFYFETFTKSQKLMIPLGLNDKCSSQTCPSLIESPYSETSLRNIRTNSAEFLRIFNGDSGLGFDDLIINEEHSDIAARFQSQLADIDNKLAQISVSLKDQVAQVGADASDSICVNGFANPDTESSIEACSLSGLLKRVTDDLKIEFVAIVGVALPGRVQSDND